jgi:CDP-paratose 2-epimerase
MTPAMRSGRSARPTLISGGAGFIGTNLAHRLLSEGTPVLVLDNLSRPGVDRNLEWLCDTHGSLVKMDIADVRNAGAVRRAVAEASQVFHFAAQVAVTSSVVDPVTDFEINARGTLNVLEAIRACHTPPPLIFTSTNKVYGGLADIALTNRPRYEPIDGLVRAHGVDEQRPLDFHSPYGCSKGTADQYILDYARSFGVPAAVFRMSCIYGPHQCGTEDQGWVAHFLLRALAAQPLVIYGDGHQVRDILYVDDLVEAMLAAQAHMAQVSGHAFNIGGGPLHTTSLLELVRLIGSLHGAEPAVTFDAWRIGDQRYYVSDTRKFRAMTGWAPRVAPCDGVRRLYTWLRDERPRAPVAMRRVAT